MTITFVNIGDAPDDRTGDVLRLAFDKINDNFVLLEVFTDLSDADGNFIVGSPAGWVVESGATARASLGLGSMAIQDADNVLITGGSLSGITSLIVIGTLESDGDRVVSTETITTTSSMANTIEEAICNSASPITVTLPAHKTDKRIRIINKGTGTVTLSPTSGTIKGSPTESLGQWESLILLSDNTDWI